ncbi:MAG: hypothetical protein IOD15_00305 [Phycisphaerales bacterium]|nr:hypothetical protein [Phycisphaerales bacterium]
MAEPGLSTRQVAERLGYTPRTVMTWTDGRRYRPPCPHRTVIGKKGQPVFVFDLRDVLAWRRLQGLPEPREVAETAGGPLFEPRAAEPAASGRAEVKTGADLAPMAMTPETVTAQAGQVLALLDQALRAGQLLPGQVQQLATTVKHLEAVARLQAEQRAEEEKRAGLLIERQTAQRILNAVATVVRTGLEAASASLPGLVRQAVVTGGAVTVADEQTDAFDRVAAVAVRQWAERTLASMASGVELAAADLERQGGERTGGVTAAEGVAA